MNRFLQSLLGKFLGETGKKNLLYYVSQMFMLASPIIVLPYLGRVVGPVGIGLYGSGQALALLVTTVVEFNLVQSGSRQAAKVRNDSVRLRGLVADVFGTKILLTLLSAAICCGLFFSVGIMQANKLVFSMALVFGIMQGHSVYWFFGGTGNLQFVALTDVFGRLIGIFVIFVFVHSADQMWLVFLAQAIGSGLGIFAAIGFMLFKFTGLVRPDFAGGVSFIRSNVHLFFQNFVGTLYTGSTSLIMGFVSGAGAVGYFSAAERMIRAGVMPTMPLRQTFFPSVTALVNENPAKSRRLVRRLLFLSGGFNLCISLFLFCFSAPIIHIMFGHGFEESILVLRLLAVLPLLLTLQDVVSNLWLIPLHQDRYCSLVVMIAGITHVIGIGILASLWGAIGTAIAMLLSNSLASIMIVGKALSMPMNPIFWDKKGIYRV